MFVVMSPTEAKLGLIMIKVTFIEALDFFSKTSKCVKRISLLVLLLVKLNFFQDVNEEHFYMCFKERFFSP